jgi:lipopolysaccharide export system permease protein
MPLIERYIFRRATQAFLLTLAALTAALWVTQVLRELDVVTANGQAISVFLLMTFFALPALVQVIAPIAYLVATIVTLNNLGSDGELPVVSAAGASPKAVNRPIILLGTVVMIAVAFSHHVLAPGALARFRVLLTHVRADVIATLVQEGGFRDVDDGLTMHFRDKAPDGTFRDVFVNDERDPQETVTFTSASGVLLEHASGSFLVLQHGDLIRSQHTTHESNVVSFETYALDLSQIGTPNAAPVYEAQERSTLFLLDPQAGDPFSVNFPERVRAEIHERTAAPLFTLAFGLIALAFLGRPHSNRQDRGAAIAFVVALCLALRTAGFAATAVSRNLAAALPFMYAVPAVGIALGAYGTIQGWRLRAPPIVARGLDRLIGRARRAAGRSLTLASVVDGDTR